jgi:hypothetical protein
METNSSPQSLKSSAQKRKERLQELEVLIHGSRLRTGEALVEIRDDRLYRDEYSSFDAYCKERWGHNRAWADRLISSVKSIADLEKKADEQSDPIGSTFPLNESQTRALRGLTPDQQIQVMREVSTSGKKVTAALITDYAKKYKQPQQELEEEDGPEDTTDSGEPLALNEQEIDIQESDLRERLRRCLEYIQYQQARINHLEYENNQFKQENAELKIQTGIIYALATGQMHFILTGHHR